jgi:DNA polymerase III alpha subunit
LVWDIYLGFGFLYALETNIIKRLLKERNRQGPYQSLDDFIERVPISIEQVSILIKTNAFRFTERNKRELLWEAHMKIQKSILEEPQPMLFKTARVHYKTPNLPHTLLEDAFDEMELLGYPLCHPFQLLQKQESQGIQAKDLSKWVHKTMKIKGYLVTVKNTATSKGERMFFGTFLDENGDFIDTVHFPPVAKNYRFRGKGIYEITGKVVEEFDCITIEVSKMELLPIVEDPRYAEGAVQTRIHGKRYKNVV